MSDIERIHFSSLEASEIKSFFNAQLREVGFVSLQTPLKISLEVKRSSSDGKVEAKFQVESVKTVYFSI